MQLCLLIRALLKISSYRCGFEKSWIIRKLILFLFPQVLAICSTALWTYGYYSLSLAEATRGAVNQNIDTRNIGSFVLSIFQGACMLCSSSPPPPPPSAIWVTSATQMYTTNWDLRLNWPLVLEIKQHASKADDSELGSCSQGSVNNSSVGGFSSLALKMQAGPPGFMWDHLDGHRMRR